MRRGFTLSGIRAKLDGADLDRSWWDGQRLTMDEAVAVALGELEQDA